jgi:CDI immunity proteins
LAAKRQEQIAVMGAFDRSKSLQELEEHDWGDPAPTDSSLVAKCMQLRRKPLAEFTAGDLRIMIGEQISLSYLIGLAVEHLELDPFVEATFYPGDLLCAVVRLDEDFWINHPDSLERLRPIVKKAVKTAASSEAAVGDEVRKELEDVPRILRPDAWPIKEELCGAFRLMLKELAVGASIPKSREFTEVLLRLEWSLPGIIREIHPEFDESLDGIVPYKSVKIAEDAIDIYGLCWLIGDQTLTPLHVSSKLPPTRMKSRGWSAAWVSYARTNCCGYRTNQPTPGGRHFTRRKTRSIGRIRWDSANAGRVFAAT